MSQFPVCFFWLDVRSLAAPYHLAGGCYHSRIEYGTFNAFALPLRPAFPKVIVVALMCLFYMLLLSD